MTDSRRWPGLLLAALSALLLIVPLVALAPPAEAMHPRGQFHWSQKSYPMNRTVRDATTSSWRSTSGYGSNASVIKTVIGQANLSSKLGLSRYVDSNHASLRQACNGVSGQIRICNYNYGATGWAGLAEATSTNYHFNHGRNKLNDYYVNSTSFQRQVVMCHELHHAVGLGHSTNNNTCTNTKWDGASPDSHDRYQLDVQHNHTHSDGGDGGGSGDGGGGGGGSNCWLIILFCSSGSTATALSPANAGPLPEIEQTVEVSFETSAGAEVEVVFDVVDSSQFDLLRELNEHVPAARGLTRAQLQVSIE